MPREFRSTRLVHFAETDMAGIAHFSNFLRWMEEAEHAFFRSVGLSIHTVHEGLPLGWPRVSVGCEYFGPVRFEETLERVLRLTRVGDKSLQFECDFLLNGRRIALGKSTSVCCVFQGGAMKGIPIPPEIRNKLEA